MTANNMELPATFKWKFLLSLVTALRAVRPRIVELISISITPIKKTRNRHKYDFRAVIKGRVKIGAKPIHHATTHDGRHLMFMGSGGDFEWIFEHREECLWDNVGR